MPLDLSQFSVILLDLDGTIYHEEHALPGAADLIAALRRAGRTFACLSNSTASPSFIAARLARLGMTVRPDQIYPAASAACDYVMAHFGRDGRVPRVFNCGTDAVREMLTGKVHFVEVSDASALISRARSERLPCDAVIVGTPGGTFATPDRQRHAVQLLRDGAKLVGICADRVYPSPRGLEIGAGGLTAMLAYAAKVEPTFCGKPEAVFFHELCTRLGVSPDRCVLVGDNPETDIAGGRGVGMKTILTLTGIVSAADAARLPEALRADEVIESLADLVARIFLVPSPGAG